MVTVTYENVYNLIFPHNQIVFESHYWWLVELPMWLTDSFLDTFFGRWRGAVRIHMSHVQLTCGINMHSNYYYMVEGSPHMWQLT